MPVFPSKQINALRLLFKRRFADPKIEEKQQQQRGCAAFFCARATLKMLLLLDYSILKHITGVQSGFIKPTQPFFLFHETGKFIP